MEHTIVAKWRVESEDREAQEALCCCIRKRAIHKNTLQSFATTFTRYVIFVMPLEEYNEVHGNLANLKE